LIALTIYCTARNIPINAAVIDTTRAHNRECSLKVQALETSIEVGEGVELADTVAVVVADVGDGTASLAPFKSIAVPESCANPTEGG